MVKYFSVMFSTLVDVAVTGTLKIMYLLGEQPAYTDKLVKRLQSIPYQLLEGLPPSGAPIEMQNSANLLASLAKEQLFLIDSGLVHVLVDGRPVFYLQEGDLLGLRRGLELSDYHYSTEDNLRLIPYCRRELFQHIAACPNRHEQYTFYLLGHSALLTEALVLLKQPDINAPTGFKTFAAGDKLIHAGDIAEDVFIIIEGRAEAWVNGQKVGEIEKDEIFGAMAVFTDEPRNATVIASEPCTVMLIPKDQFITLMHSNPRIAHSLIESMARRIDLMNKEITGLRNISSSSPTT